jgi:hypothetical protein
LKRGLDEEIGKDLPERPAVLGNGVSEMQIDLKESEEEKRRKRLLEMPAKMLELATQIMNDEQ